MKTRNIDLEQSSLLMNHIYKYIVLEAPTIAELDKKIKKYETLLITAITDVYKISSFTFKSDNSYSISPTQSYQIGIFFHFNGKRKENINNPDATLNHLKQLALLENKKKQISHIIYAADLPKNEMISDIIVIEANSEDEINDAISNKQRDYIKNIITTTNLTYISFLNQAKTKDAQTGKITLTMSVNYQTKQIHKNHTNKVEKDDR